MTAEGLRFDATALDDSFGVRLTHSSSWFELCRVRPTSRPVFYRVDYGRLDWGTDLAAFAPAESPPVDPGALVAYVHGGAPAPDRTPLPGVRTLTLGTTVRLDARGIVVTPTHPAVPAAPPGLATAVGHMLEAQPAGYAVAYSGGLASAFLAACALQVGHRPVLVHADLGPASSAKPLPVVPDLRIERVSIDLSELLDHDRMTGSELAPPLPDIEVPRLMAERLAQHIGAPLVGGMLIEDLVSVKLPQVDTGLRGWRLLGCEPFHIAGVLPSLKAARTLLEKKVVYSSPDGAGVPLVDKQQLKVPPAPSPTGVSNLPGLTEQGREAFESNRRGAMAMWKEHLEAMPPVLARLVAGLEERGDGGMVAPALDPGVIAAVAAIPARDVGRIRSGVFQNQLPLHQLVDRHRIVGVRRAASGHWLRLAAAHHLRRERRKIIAQLDRESSLSDLGLFDSRALQATLRDGRDLAEHALPLLRMLWLDRWLRGRT
ncbi:hypothetical protein [Micromonospora sp. NPDC047134]|uniref:hypothetical protein n=1 Tax=Micromonospora sp. NPDC047134 TaxID=3154340 RepID=UPI0033CF499F